MTREDLANQFVGQGVELGVAAGEFSAAILSNPKVSRLWSIDRWSDHHDDAEYETACRLLGPFGIRSRVKRSTFAAAVPDFADGSLDFVYVDGYAHTGQEGGQTLADWWPKVKPGGIFAGHDYHPRWRPTMDAVDAFEKQYGVQAKLTVGDEYASWWIIKP